MTHPISAFRTEHGLTLEQFASLVGAQKAAVSKWERRKVGPSPQMARVIEEKTGIAKEALRPDIFAPNEGAQG